MANHGRGDDVTNVVYPGAGHTFSITRTSCLRRGWRPAPVRTGGSSQADHLASEDAWQRVVSFLKASKVPIGAGRESWHPAERFSRVCPFQNVRPHGPDPVRRQPWSTDTAADCSRASRVLRRKALFYLCLGCFS